MRGIDSAWLLIPQQREDGSKPHGDLRLNARPAFAYPLAGIARNYARKLVGCDSRSIDRSPRQRASCVTLRKRKNAKRDNHRYRDDGDSERCTLHAARCTSARDHSLHHSLIPNDRHAVTSLLVRRERQREHSAKGQ
jgi:hypothetical protein